MCKKPDKMEPSLSKVNLPNQSDEHFVHIINDLLSSSEYKQIIEDNEGSLISTSGAYSGRLRYMFFDHSLVEML